MHRLGSGQGTTEQIPEKQKVESRAWQTSQLPLKYCFVAPLLGRLSLETQEMLGIDHSVHSEKHHENYESRNSHQEKSTEKLKDVLDSANVFSDTSEHLHTLLSKKVSNEEGQVVELE